MAVSEQQTPSRLYHLLADRKIADGEGLPSEAELALAEEAASGLWGFLLGPIAGRVATVANASVANSASYEDIGRLLIWADHVRRRLEEGLAEVAKVTLAHEYLYELAGGYTGGGESPFTDSGAVIDDGQ